MIHLAILAVVIGIGIALGQRLVGSRPGHYPPTGWYPDPWQEHVWRWWNGAWTGHVHD